MLRRVDVASCRSVWWWPLTPLRLTTDKDPEGRTKLELVTLLADALAVEAEILGKKRQAEIRNTELLIRDFVVQKKKLQAEEVRSVDRLPTVTHAARLTCAVSAACARLQLRNAIKKLWQPLGVKQQKIQVRLCCARVCVARRGHTFRSWARCTLQEERDKLKLQQAEEAERVLEEEYIMQRLKRQTALEVGGGCSCTLVATARSSTAVIGCVRRTRASLRPRVTGISASALAA